MRKIKFIAIHCTASPQSQKVEAILSYWKSNGWNAPGYHHLIMPNGEDKKLLEIEKVSNGVLGFNSVSINLCYLGGVEVRVIEKNKRPVNLIGKPIDNRTEAQKKTLITLIEKYSIMFPDAVIQGHRDFSPDKNRDGIITPNEWMKACPSFSVATWLKEIGFKSKIKKDIILTTTTNVNIRTGQGSNFQPVRPALPKGTAVKFLGNGNDWTYVQVLDDKKTIGWISSMYLTSPDIFL